MFLSVSGVDRFMPVVTALRPPLQHRGPGLPSLLRATWRWPELAIRSPIRVEVIADMPVVGDVPVVRAGVADGGELDRLAPIRARRRGRSGLADSVVPVPRRGDHWRRFAVSCPAMSASHGMPRVTSSSRRLAASGSTTVPLVRTTMSRLTRGP